MRGLDDFESVDTSDALVILVLAAINIIAVAQILSLFTPYTLTNWVSVFGTIGSLTLSAVLALLYLDMSSIQEQQMEIMRAKEGPELRIRNREWDTPEEFLDLEEVEEDELTEAEKNFRDQVIAIQIEVENVGPGNATNLRLEPEVYVHVENLDFWLEPRFSGIVPTGGALTTDDTAPLDLLVDGEGEALDSGSREEMTALFMISHINHPEYAPFSKMVSSGEETFGGLVDQSVRVDQIAIQIDIGYDYLSNFDGEKKVTRIIAEYNDGVEMMDILKEHPPTSSKIFDEIELMNAAKLKSYVQQDI